MATLPAAPVGDPHATQEQDNDAQSTNRKIVRQRRRLKKSEAYNPNYTVLSTIVPEGVLTQTKAMVDTQQRGNKNALRVLRSIEFHEGMVEEYDKMVQFHRDHNEKLVTKLEDIIIGGPSTKVLREGVGDFLNGLDDPILQSIAQAKGIDPNLTRDELIEKLTKYGTAQSDMEHESV